MGARMRDWDTTQYGSVKLVGRDAGEWVFEG